MSYLIDSHCHVHDDSYGFHWGDVVAGCKEASVGQMICIGTDAQNSQAAVDFARDKAGVYVAIGLHPHEAARIGEDDFELLTVLSAEEKVVAIGECGLDYYYNHSTPAEQRAVLEFQLALARQAGKPCVFHVREAFDDFWPVYEEYRDITGVIHSFSGTESDMKAILERNLYVGLNGIMLFSKDPAHRRIAAELPLEKLLLETDAPYLTPPPLRGTMNEPANVRLVAAYLAGLREIPVDTLIEATTSNARKLFRLRDDTIT